MTFMLRHMRVGLMYTHIGVACMHRSLLSFFALLAVAVGGHFGPSAGFEHLPPLMASSIYRHCVDRGGAQW